ncbi:hypothetical protein C8Q74DRAFT_406669 [Fomes fomentarius]|nr:hypothetical protein C8Q74DRAFT_406669 [Fomes fomentarius]
MSDEHHQGLIPQSPPDDDQVKIHKCSDEQPLATYDASPAASTLSVPVAIPERPICQPDRPPNSFLLFRSSRARGQGEQVNLSRLLAGEWNAMSKEEQEPWSAKAKVLRKAHVKSEEYKMWKAAQAQGIKCPRKTDLKAAKKRKAKSAHPYRRRKKPSASPEIALPEPLTADEMVPIPGGHADVAEGLWYAPGPSSSVDPINVAGFGNGLEAPWPAWMHGDQSGAFAAQDGFAMGVDPDYAQYIPDVATYDAGFAGPSFAGPSFAGPSFAGPSFAGPSAYYAGFQVEPEFAAGPLPAVEGNTDVAYAPGAEGYDGDFALPIFESQSVVTDVAYTLHGETYGGDFAPGFSIFDCQPPQDGFHPAEGFPWN